MRKLFQCICVLATVMVLATSTLAFEKTAARMYEDRPTGWDQATTCTVAYYNYCTGWIWCWSGWSPGDMLGVCFEPCCGPPPALVMASWAYFCTGAPSGYGFTGTTCLQDFVPSDCSLTPPPLGMQPFLPQGGWNQWLWNVPIFGDRFIWVASFQGVGNPAAAGSDHPAAGPTGPVACGYCYPTTRVTHSYYYGTCPTTIISPGSPLNDGVCDVELLWDVQMVCDIGVESSSWGAIKALYR